ncbi:hypothetical protein ACH5RR_024515 [Cinchona calisaya]|uniref:Myb/SANT-like DNA-binding domain-containing protein n=1 Tax=Cinchona calisaya TaxID=153742 RepID=A0ABD2YWY6_9GENT
MDREANNQEKSSHLSTTTNNNNNNNREDRLESPKKPQLTTTASNNNNNSDRVKRDEWSEGAVSSLLEAYETKWVLRNRAKLKGQDWEDVAKHVSARANSTKSSKTQTQCKNKIESMKKRYRSESAAVDAASSSSWPLYPRLDLLLRGNAPPPPLPPPPPPPVVASNPHLLMLEQSLHPQPRPPAQNSHGSNGCDRAVKEDGVGPKLSDQESDKNATETDDSSTPVIYSDKEKLKSKNLRLRKDQKNRKKNQRREKCAISESIRLLAEVVVRSEQARMETMRELERMRAETEAKRGEMDLKRTEIIANTQLEIAKLFAAVSGKGGLDSSLRIGRS